MLFERCAAARFGSQSTPGGDQRARGFAAAAILVSGALLMWAQRTIPMGTAYAIWTGIGAVGAFTVGILAFGDTVSTIRIVSIGLIVAGIVGLKLA